MKRAAVVVASLLVLVAACDPGSDPGNPASGTVTFGADEGVDLFSGRVRDPGNYANSDLVASKNGDGLKLSTGGDSPTHNRHVNWFKTGGGVPRSFASLAEVPDERPTELMVDPLVKAKTGNGFLVERADGGFTKGRIVSADATSVTLEFAPAP